MPRKYRLTAYKAAILTLHLLAVYSDDKGRGTARARISQATLRRLSGRTSLREVFVNEWIEELGLLGWSAFQVGDNFALIHTETIENWPRVASTRIREDLNKVLGGDDAEFDRIEFSILDEDSEEDGED